MINVCGSEGGEGNNFQQVLVLSKRFQKHKHTKSLHKPVMSTEPNKKETKESAFIDDVIDNKLSDAEQQRRLITEARKRRELMKAFNLHDDLTEVWATSYKPEDKQEKKDR